MLKNVLPIALILIGIAVMAVIAVIVKNATRKKPSEYKKPVNATAINVLTEHEMKLWVMLKKACFSNDLVPLAQTAFGGFLKVNKADWNKIGQKRADFLICNTNMFPIAVIELDDNSHNGKEIADKARDELIKTAGIKTIRFAKLPEPLMLEKWVASLNKTG